MANRPSCSAFPAEICCFCGIIRPPSCPYTPGINQLSQVCSYRCITSYESRQLEEFSLCIIQKHNCFGLSAEIPMVRS